MSKIGDFVSDALKQVGEKSFLLSEIMSFVVAIIYLVIFSFDLPRVVLPWSQSKLPVVLHVTVLFVFFVILGWWAWLISGDRGKKLFKSLYKRGITWPFLFSIALLFFAIFCFTSLTSTLNVYHLIKFDPAMPTKEAKEFD